MAGFADTQQFLDLVIFESILDHTLAVTNATILDLEVNNLSHDNLSTRRNDLIEKLRIATETRIHFEKYGRMP